MLGWLSALAPPTVLWVPMQVISRHLPWDILTPSPLCVYTLGGTHPVLLGSYLLTCLWGPPGRISFGRTMSSASFCSPAGTWRRCWYSINICEINKQMKNGQHVTIISNSISVSVTPEYSKEGLFVPTSPFWWSNHLLQACICVQAFFERHLTDITHKETKNHCDLWDRKHKHN